MSRVIVLALWFVIGLTGVTAPMLAFAEGTVGGVATTIPATQGAGYWQCASPSFVLGTGSTAQEACAMPRAAVVDPCPNFNTQTGICKGSVTGAFYDSGWSRWYVYFSGAQYCTLPSCAGGKVYGEVMNANLSMQEIASTPTNVAGALTCPSGYNLSGSNCVPVSQCGSNATASGSSCVCNAGFDPSGGQCVARNCDADKMLSGHIPSGASAGLVCSGGCQAEVVSASNQYKAGGNPVIAGTWAQNGQTCDPATNNLTPPGTEEACAAGTVPISITVSGVTSVSCVAASSDTPVVTTEKAKQTVNTGAGSPVTTTTTTTRQDTGSGITTSTTSQSGAGDPQTTTTTQSKGAFCEANPNASICRGGLCADSPNTITCAESYGTVEDSSLQTVSVGPSSISIVSVAKNATCPDSVQLPVGEFSFAGMCQFAVGIRPVVLAMAWIGAAFILFGAFREG